MDFSVPVKRKGSHLNLSLRSPQESEEIDRGQPRQISYGIREKHPSFLQVVDKHNPYVSSNANSWATKSLYVEHIYGSNIKNHILSE